MPNNSTVEESLSTPFDAGHVMSLHSRWTQEIYAGRKSYEFRRGAPRLAAGDVVLVYETMPVGLITGSFRVLGVIEGSPNDLAALEAENDVADHVREYLADSKRCCAFHIGEVQRFDNPLELAQIGLSRGPMSYQRIP